VAGKLIADSKLSSAMQMAAGLHAARPWCRASFAHMTAQTERLTEREPVLSAEAVLDHRAPQDQHIDA
jgi:hypothetical protein